jgi:NADH-quinone oxidoreductase subunit G
MEMAERVPGYQGITHSSLAKTGQRGTWGRQINEAIYYDGTNYENTEGVGIQYPAPSENLDPKSKFSLKPLPYEELVTNEKYPFVLLVQRLLYDDDALLRDSRLLNHIPAPFVALNRADAQKLEIAKGDTVRVSSAAGALDLPARLTGEVPEGSVLVPAHLSEAPLTTLQTGPRTRVAVSKIDE